MFFFKIPYILVCILSIVLHTCTSRKNRHIAGTKYERYKRCDKVLEKGPSILHKNFMIETATIVF